MRLQSFGERYDGLFCVERRYMLGGFQRDRAECIQSTTIVHWRRGLYIMFQVVFRQTKGAKAASYPKPDKRKLKSFSGHKLHVSASQLS